MLYFLIFAFNFLLFISVVRKGYHLIIIGKLYKVCTFKSVFGKRFSKYLDKIRLTKVMADFCEKPDSVKAISDETSTSVHPC